MVREMIDFYVEQTVMPKFEGLVSRKQLDAALQPKCDFLIFNEYVRKQLEKEANNTKEMQTDERIFKME